MSKLAHLVLCGFILVTSQVTTHSFAFASGATSSGGGNGISNRTNPWFLENTSHVPYCVDIDEVAMGVTYDRAAQMVDEVLEFWRQSYALAAFPRYVAAELVPYGQLRIATQHFQRVSCSEATLLRFQLGTLTPEQLPLLQGDDDVIGVAMRTVYDPVNLQGQGFVYITPQTGALKTRSAGFSDEAWSVCDGCLLKTVLTHEVGHIFGLEHSGQRAGIGEVMSAMLPAELTLKDTVDAVKEQPQLIELLSRLFNRPYFTLDTQLLLVSSVDQGFLAWEFLGLQGDENRLELVNRWNPDHISAPVLEAVSHADPEGGRRIVGEFCGNWSMGSSGTSLQNVFLPDEQEVFARVPEEDFKVPRLLGASYGSMDEVVASGQLCLRSPSAQRERIATHTVVTRSGGTMLAAWEDEIEPQFLYEGPGGRFLTRRRSSETEPAEPVDDVRHGPVSPIEQRFFKSATQGLVQTLLESLPAKASAARRSHP